MTQKACICTYASMNWVILGSGNGLSPVRCQVITWYETNVSSTGTPGTKFSENWMKRKWLLSRKCIWQSRLQNVIHFVSQCINTCFQCSWSYSLEPTLQAIFMPTITHVSHTIWNRVPGTHFTNGLWAHTWNLVKIHVALILIKRVIPTGHNFCTCHDSSAVVACAKLWPVLIIISRIRATYVFTIFRLWMNKPFVWNVHQNV